MQDKTAIGIEGYENLMIADYGNFESYKFGHKTYTDINLRLKARDSKL